MNDRILTSNEEVDAALRRLQFHAGSLSLGWMDLDVALVSAEIGRLRKAANAHETGVSPETSIDMAHSSAYSAFAERHGGRGPELPTEEAWEDGYMHALLDIGRRAQKARDGKETVSPPSADGPALSAPSHEGAGPSTVGGGQKAAVPTDGAQCSWGCYYDKYGSFTRNPACTVHGADEDPRIVGY